MNVLEIWSGYIHENNFKLNSIGNGIPAANTTVQQDTTYVMIDLPNASNFVGDFESPAPIEMYTKI